MIDIKKLITGFLALAILAGSGAFVFSSFFDSRGQDPVSSPKNELSDSLATVGDNAFVESLAQTFEDPQSLEEESELPPIIKSDNFTENLASHLSQELAVADPENYDALTSQLISLPDQIDMVSDGVIDPIETKEVISDFEAGILSASNNFKIDKNYGPDDLNNYIEELNSVLEKNLLSSWVKTLESQGPSVQGVDALSVIVQRTLTGVNEIEVPESLGSFHRSFLKVLAYEQSILNLTDNVDDPLRATIIFESQELNYNLALAEFQAELEKINTLEGISLSGKSSGLSNLMTGIFQPKVAYAIFGIGDISIDPINLARMIWEFARKVVTELLKDKLVKMLVNQTLNWIKGKGDPQYITDFGGFIGDAADQAAGNVLYKINPSLCSSFGPLVTLALTPVRNLQDRTRCTITQVINNATDFYNDFSDGGWIGYAYAINPSNNLFGSIIQVHDEAVRAAAAESEKKKTEAESSSGFLSTQICVNKKTHSLSEIMGPPGPSPEADARYIAEGAGEKFIKMTGLTTFESCPPDGWENTTPGETVGRALDTALGAPLHRIVNAEDLIGLAAAFVDSALNRLIQAGVNGIRGTSGTSNRQPIRPEDSCKHLDPATVEYADCLREAQEIASSTQQIALSRNDLLTAANAYILRYTEVINLDNNWLNDQPGVIELLRNVRGVCDRLSPDQQSEIDRLIVDITLAELTVKRQIAEAQNAIALLQNYILRVNNATEEELGVLTSELEERFNATFLNLMVDEARELSKQLSEVRSRWNFIWSTRFNQGAFPPNLCTANPPVSSCVGEPNGKVCTTGLPARLGTCQSQVCIPN